MVYGEFKYLTRRTVSDKILSAKAFDIVKDPKYEEYQRGRFDKKTCGSGIKNENIYNKELTEELHKAIVRKFDRKVHSLFKDNIWGTDLADMQLISKFNNALRLLLLCVIDIQRKYALAIPLKNKKRITTTNVFKNILDESNRKPLY